MKKIAEAALLLFLLCGVFVLLQNKVLAEDEVRIDESHFPDEIFRGYVRSNFDTDEDGILSLKEREAVTWIDLVATGVSDMSGIEYFPMLETLRVNDNCLTSLDLTKNPELVLVNVDDNERITELDVTHNPHLVHLVCGFNQLESLDLTHNPELEVLILYGNRVSSLDLSRNPLLMHLNCGNNQLSSLDLRNNPLLYELECMGNPLTELDISGNPCLLKAFLKPSPDAYGEYTCDGPHPSGKEQNVQYYLSVEKSVSIKTGEEEEDTETVSASDEQKQETKTETAVSDTNSTETDVSKEHEKENTASHLPWILGGVLGTIALSIVILLLVRHFRKASS